MRLPPRTALLVLLAVFLAGNVLAATATGYGVMLTARIVTGVASQAFFGVALSLCARLTRPEIRGRAVAVALNGLMLGTLLGLPLSTLIGERLGWRAAFWAVSVLALAAGAATAARRAMARPRPERRRLRAEAGVFARPRLWRAPATSTLVIGATFAAFSYFNPILTGLTGFPAATVPLLLIAYGAAHRGRRPARRPVRRAGPRRGPAAQPALPRRLRGARRRARPRGGLPAGHRSGGRHHEPGDGHQGPARRQRRPAGQQRPHLVHHARRHRRLLARRRGPRRPGPARPRSGSAAALAALGLLTVLPELRRTGGPARRGGTPVAHGAAAPEVRETVRRG
ncbi:MFS transporter [Streptomyces echinatus]|uniref:MFS transporter n=1 Tax=Streptomyces echinatus TaxID=67293 RepID=UPI003CD0B58C